jgi:Zn-dependent protease with chaperone function
MRPRVLIFAVSLVLFGPWIAPARERVDSPSTSTTTMSDEERIPVAVEEPSTLAMRYYWTGNWLWAIDQVWEMAIPVLVLFTGTAARFRDLAVRFGRKSFFAVGIFVVLYLALAFVLDLPLLYYQGFVRQHAYGLSRQTFSRWFGHELKWLMVAATGGVLFAWIPLRLIERRPKRWWLDLSLLSVPYLFFVLLITPILIDPMFNKHSPLKNRDLETKILELARRAGIGCVRIFVVEKSVDTKTVNAKVTGFLGTKRIVLWDTLIDDLDEKQVLVVVGHEMGHYVLGHLSRSIFLSTIILLLGLLWVDRAGRWLIARFRDRFLFERLSDIAAIPLLILLLKCSLLVLGPVANAYSRFQEHEADCFALELTRTNRTAALAFVGVQHENLINPRPNWFYRTWRATHPSIGERIDFCNSYHPWDEGRPMRYQGWIQP